MRLYCVNNQYKISGPNYMNDPEMEKPQTARLTVGESYSGQIIYDELSTPGEYVNYGASQKMVFVCFNNEGEWVAYPIAWFSPKEP